MGYRNYAPANGFHVNPNGTADFTSVNSAIAAATSGQTVYLHGTVTENVTLKAGVDIVSWPGEGNTPNATIIGTLSFASAGTVTVSGIRLQTNSANFLSVTGSSASIVNLNNCYLNASNNTGISFTTSNTGAFIIASYCSGDVGTTGIGMHSVSSTGTLNYRFCQLTNSGATVTSSSNSAGIVQLNNTNLAFPLSSSSTGAINLFSGTTVDTSTQNTIAITANGTGGGSSYLSRIFSGSASAITIGTGVTYSVYSSVVGSSNTNMITGVGTINYGGLTIAGTSATINTTTQTIAGTIKGSTTTAPTSGYIGELILTTVGTGGGVSLSNGIAKTVATVSLTAGIWDVSTMCVVNGTVQTRFESGPSLVTNTLGTGGVGIDTVDLPTSSTAAAGVTGTCLPVRFVLSATTNVFMVAQVSFTGSATASGTIRAVRVG